MEIEGKGNFMGRNLTITTLAWACRLTSAVIGHVNSRCPCWDGMRRALYLCDLPLPNP